MTKGKEPIFDRPRSPEDLAVFFGCTPKFIYKEIREGRLRGRKFSDRMIRVMPSDIIEWLNNAATIS
jgi:hypothetical protein